MTDYIRLPDGSLFPRNEGESEAEAKRAAVQKYPEAFGLAPVTPAAQPQSGFFPAVKAGFKGVEKDIAALAGRSGLMDLQAAEDYRKQKADEIAQSYKPVEQSWGEAPWAHIKELAGQSLGYMAGPAVAGAAAMLLPEEAAAAPVIAGGSALLDTLGLGTVGEATASGLAGLAGTAQFAGSNLSRQVEEGKKLGETNLGAAVGAAIPQAALDVFGLHMVPGIRGIFGQAGEKISDSIAEQIAKQGLSQVAKDYALATGKAMGAEGLNEAGQQVFERLQAGLSLTDPDARKEYLENFLGGAVLGGIAAPAGRYVERSSIAQQQAQDQAKKDAADAEAARNTPEALGQLDNDFRAAQQQLAALNQKVADAKPKKGATDEEKQAHQDLKQERADFVNTTFRPLLQEHTLRKDAIDKMYSTQQEATEFAAGQNQPTANKPNALTQGTFDTKFGDVLKAAPYQAVPLNRLMNQYHQLRKQSDALADKLQEGVSPQDQPALVAQYKQLNDQMGQMAPTIHQLGGTTDTLEQLQKKIATADTNRLNALRLGELDKAGTHLDEYNRLQTLVPKVQDAQQQVQQLGQTRDLFNEAPAPKEQDERAQQAVLQSEKDRRDYGVQSQDVRKQNAMEAFSLADLTPGGDLVQAPETTDKALSPLRFSQLKNASEKLDAAHDALAEAVQSGNQVRIDAALRDINKYEAEQSRLGEPTQKNPTIDLFDPSNIMREAVARNDMQTAMQYASARDESKAADLEQATQDRQNLMQALDDRLGLAGFERKQRGFGDIARALAGLFSKEKSTHWSKKLVNSEALLRAGTFPDAEAQAKYDASPEAFAHDYVMGRIEEMRKKVSERQGNEKESKLQKLAALEKERNDLMERLESGLAAPGMGEKVAGLQEKLKGGEKPKARQMDAGERAAVNRRLKTIDVEHAKLMEKIKPVEDSMVRMYNTMFEKKPLKTVKETTAAKQALSAAPAERAKANLIAARDKLKNATERYMASKSFGDKEEMKKARKEMRQASTLSREARRAQRAADVSKVARADSETLEKIAYKHGVKTEGFMNAIIEQHDRLEKLKRRYGEDDPRVREFIADSREALIWRAIAEGRKTPEFRAERAEHIQKIESALKQSTQETKSMRTGPVTRNASQAARYERTGSPESRAATQARQETASMRSLPAQVNEAMRGGKSAEKTKVKRTQADKQAVKRLGEALTKEPRKMLRGVETESQALSQEHISMLEQGDIQGVLSALSKDKSVDEFSRAVAARLAPLLDATKSVVKDSVVDDEGKEVLGAATSKLVELNRKTGLSVETLLHEATHAAAERVVQLAETDPSKLTREQQVAINELKAIHAQIKRDAGVTSANAKGSLSEFVAEVMSNRNLQKQLAQRKWRLSNMWDGFKSVIMRMLGVKDVETMFGASVVSVERLFTPTSVRVGTAPETRTTRQLSAKDIAALHTGSNSMKQFSEQFGDRIKQKDRTPEDVERIASDVIDEMATNISKKYPDTPVVAMPTADSLDYKAMATMSDGKLFDPDNALHFVEAEPATLAASRAMTDDSLRRKEADAIGAERRKDFKKLLDYLNQNYKNYTLAETALVLKAAAKWGVISGKDGKLKLVEIRQDNRHNVAVVGKEGVDAVIEQLRDGKSLKQAFLDGLQKAADENAKTNERRNGWKKFNQSDNEKAAIDLNAGCAGTPWCTGASVGTARSQISKGDFYVYYKDGRPEVAVRMDGKDNVGEVRGNSPNQALNKEQQATAETFLRTQSFKADKYLEELGRKSFLTALMKDPSYSDYSHLLKTRNIVDNKEISDSSVSTLLRFSNINGYSYEKPSAAVVEKVKERLTHLVEKAYQNGDYIGTSLSVRDGNVKDEVVFNKHQYSNKLNDIKSLYSIDITGRSEYAIPALERVNKVNMLAENASMPALKHAEAITMFSNGNVTLSIPKTATVGVLDVYGRNSNAVTLIGGRYINTIEAPANGATMYVPDVKYAKINTVKAGTVFHDAELAIYSRVRELLGNDYSLMNTSFDELNAQQQDVVTQYMHDFSKATGKKIKSIKSGAESVSAIASHIAHEAYDTLVRDNDMSGLFELNAKLTKTGFVSEYANLQEAEGIVDAPSVVADSPYGQEYEEAPEERRFAKQQEGVVDDGKNGFKFLRRKTTVNSVVGQEPGVVDKFLGSMMGLAGRVQLVDQYAASAELLKVGVKNNKITDDEALNVNYLLRFGQQVSHYAQQFMLNGPVDVRQEHKKWGVETVYRSKKGATLMDAAEALHEAGLAKDVDQENMFTLYLVGDRANSVGWDKVNFSDPAAAKAEYNGVMSRLNSNQKAKDAFEKAKRIYNEYNAGLIDFLQKTGSITKELADKLKSTTYVPFYRVAKNGEVQLMLDVNTHVKISNIKDEPYLKELVGGNTAILPVFTSAAQNTYMITRMGLRNQAVKETVFALQKVGTVSRIVPGRKPEGPDYVGFKRNGKDYYAAVDSDAYGIPAELVVRGMEGIKTSVPAVVKLLGIPANILRTFVTRMPAYGLRQLIRDPLNAWLMTGTDAAPVLSAMKEMGKMVTNRSEAGKALMESGAISTNVFHGDERDVSKFLKDIAAGKSGWAKAMAKMDAIAMQADAATRAVVYNDSLKKGLSEQAALLRTLESTNFSRKGVNASMHWLSVMIPFFNAQIQGLDVAYRALKGDMPFNEQLNVRKKLVQRGMLLAMGTLAYAAYMQDDEAYKRAKPEERYSNWFVYVPGVSEPVKVPIPFEMGFLFKALPEAIWDAAVNDERSKNVMNGLFQVAMQNNPFSLPQAIKPGVEVKLGSSFYGGEIESAREKQEMPTERMRDSTTEVAKLIGSVTGKVNISPIEVDYLIRGYTGSLGVALVSLLNPLLAPSSESVAEPTTKPSKLPFIGGVFQPVEGRGTLDEAYARMKEIEQVKGTYNRLREQGNQAKANEFVQKYSNELALASTSGAVQNFLGQVAKQERMVRASPTMTTEQKDERLKKLDEIKIAYARRFLAASYRTKPQ